MIVLFMVAGLMLKTKHPGRTCVSRHWLISAAVLMIVVTPIPVFPDDMPPAADAMLRTTTIIVRPKVISGDSAGAGGAPVALGTTAETTLRVTGAAMAKDAIDSQASARIDIHATPSVATDNDHTIAGRRMPDADFLRFRTDFERFSEGLYNRDESPPPLTALPILKGTPSLEHDAVGLFVFRSPDDTFASSHSSCTGTLIAPRVVLTAAHCFDEQPVPDEYVFFTHIGGLSNVRNIRFFCDDRLPCSREKHDLALVQLSAGTLSDDDLEWAQAPPAHSVKVQLVGFGISGLGFENSGIKRAGMATVVACDETNSTIICIRTPPNSDPSPSEDVVPCLGDSGGPLLLGSASDWLIAGVARSGGSCAQHVGVKYTDITQDDYQLWIAQVLNDTTPSAAASVAVLDTGHHGFVTGDSDTPDEKILFDVTSSYQSNGFQMNISYEAFTGSNIEAPNRIFISVPEELDFDCTDTLSSVLTCRFPAGSGWREGVQYEVVVRREVGAGMLQWMTVKSL